MAKKLSPMMEHYLSVKNEYSDCVIFYRLGDFYELFFDDAIEISKELELTLTGKDCGLSERAPMCGIPYHAADIYIRRLVDNGHKVAICEQVEDPKQAKGLVERKVIKIITPGTITSSENLDDTRNNYIMCISYSGSYYGIAISDISTGKFLTTRVESENYVLDEIYKFEPSEIIYQESFGISGISFDDIKSRINVTISPAPNYYFDENASIERLLRVFNVSSIEGLGLKDFDDQIIASGALIEYLTDTQMDALGQINNLSLYFREEYMILDSSTRRNLEISETLREKKKQGSLLWVLDKTKTAMGARKLREFVEQPLLSVKKINDRLDAIESFNDNLITRDEIREYLGSVYDLERLMTRISIKTANPRDLLSFKTSLYYLPFIGRLLSELSGSIFETMRNEFDALEDLYELLDASLSEDAPITVKEGNIFKEGYDKTIDELRYTKNNAKTLLLNLEESEKEKTGIRNLRIKYNKVFGYYIEVTNSFKDKVPDYFIRKQTLANAERYSTKELNDLAGEILGAEDKLYALEYDAFSRLRDTIAGEISRVQKTAHFIAVIDSLASLSYVAVKNGYVRPLINETGVIDIKAGRHPVIEKMTKESFIPNDTFLDTIGNRISIITGPNMAGKSTYMRQTALIALMAQIGSFVPADYASICISDRIFTRVGASDDLASGQSTFMVEMSEVANILRNATKQSLIILDEIGRGTSTFDGLAIAWAVVEYIADSDVLGAKTLFATHYHELTELESRLASVNNYSIAIKQDKNSIVFLRKIVKGGADGSYGIEVAKLAGVPDAVIDRANEISEILEKENLTGNTKKIKNTSIKKKTEDDAQLSFFASTEEMNIAAELRAMDLNNMTPVKALLYLEELKERLK